MNQQLLRDKTASRDRLLHHVADPALSPLFERRNDLFGQRKTARCIVQHANARHDHVKIHKQSTYHCSAQHRRSLGLASRSKSERRFCWNLLQPHGSTWQSVKQRNRRTSSGSCTSSPHDSFSHLCPVQETLQACCTPAIGLVACVKQQEK